jgi:biotin transporter BioY
MTTRDLVLIALFTAIIVVLGLIPPVTLGFIPVPITAQSMGVMLAGCIIGAKRGALAYVLLVLLVAIGLPVLAGGRGGLAIIQGPTGGFVLGWIVATFVTGLIAERLARARSGSLPVSSSPPSSAVSACSMPSVCRGSPQSPVRRYRPSPPVRSPSSRATSSRP